MRRATSGARGLSVVSEVNVQSGPEVSFREVTVRVTGVEAHEIVRKRYRFPPMSIENTLLNGGVGEKECIDESLVIHSNN